MTNEAPGTVVLASPSLEAYGSDLQLLQSAAGLRSVGWRVIVTAPAQGRLAEKFTRLGVEVEIIDFPVLRRSCASITGLIKLFVAALLAVPRMVRLLHRSRASVLYVNTVTLPWWIVVGRLTGVPTICHVHEAEARDSRTLRRIMNMPLLLAHRTVANSQTTWDVILESVPALRRRLVLLHNGVEPPSVLPELARASATSSEVRLVVIGRLSPRKAPHVALEAAGLLRMRGRKVSLALCGTPTADMAWYQRELEERAVKDDLAGAVTFLGYTSPVWPALAGADIVLAPSLGESFGNAVVEGQMSGRPVIATRVQGHLETVRDEQSGLLVPCEDPEALAAAVAKLLDDPVLFDRLARQGRASAMEQFATDRYRRRVQQIVVDVKHVRSPAHSLRDRLAADPAA